MTQEQSTPMKSLILTFLSAVSRASPSALPEQEGLSTIHGELSSLSFPEYLKRNTLHISSLKMYPRSARFAKGAFLPRSSVSYLDWGKTLDIQIRIAELDAEFQKMLKAVSADNADAIDEGRIAELMSEKQRLTVQLEQYAAMRQKRESAKSRLDEIYTILDGLQNHPMEYDDKLVRQIIECVVVESKEKIKVVFIGGTEIEMAL